MTNKEKIINAVTECMNGMSSKEYLCSEISAIITALKEEKDDRKEKGIVLRVTSKEGVATLNQRAANIANNLLGYSKIEPEDICLYKKCKKSMKKEQNVISNITDYMNDAGGKKYQYRDVSAIVSAIKKEKDDRKEKGIIVRVKTKEGRNILNQRTACIANSLLGYSKIETGDIYLYKKCKEYEYTARTNRCHMGYKEARIRLGYDPDTGLEVII